MPNPLITILLRDTGHRQAAPPMQPPDFAPLKPMKKPGHL
jgi:hypothetical protein